MPANFLGGLLTLTVADNGNGTVTAAVTDGQISDSVYLAYWPWNHAAGGPSTPLLLAEGVIGGAGAATFTGVAVAPGFYVFQAFTGDDDNAQAVSNAVFRPVADSAMIVHDRILDAVVTMIRSLNLSGIGGAANKTAKRWFPRFLDDHDDTSGGGPGLPMVQVSPWPKEKVLGLLTGSDDVGYPVLVAFFDKANPVGSNDIPRDLKWRRQVAALFRNQRLAGVPEVVLTEWEPDLISSLQGLQSNYVVGAMGFTFRARESRGLIA